METNFAMNGADESVRPKKRKKRNQTLSHAMDIAIGIAYTIQQTHTLGGYKHNKQIICKVISQPFVTFIFNHLKC